MTRALVIALLCASPHVASAQSGWPSLGLSQPDGVTNPQLVEGQDTGIVLTGAITLGVGYVLGLGAMADEGEHNCSPGNEFGGFVGEESVRYPCGTWPYAFIPIVGNLVAVLGPPGAGPTAPAYIDYPGVRAHVDLGLFAISFASLLAQTTGVIILIIGVALPTEDFVSASLASGVTIAFEPSAPGADGGASMRLSF